MLRPGFHGTTPALVQLHTISKRRGERRRHRTTDKRFLAGNNINYRRSYNLWGLPMETFVGFQSRFDHIRVGLFNQTEPATPRDREEQL